MPGGVPIGVPEAASMFKNYPADSKQPEHYSTICEPVERSAKSSQNALS